MNCPEIRRRFVEYYKGLGFHPLPRAPMLHPSIPMSFVMSAGLVQVETSLANVQERLGSEFVLVQECFRYFDLEKVGTDDFHLSLFEMPGAFIFSPDGKAETVQRMWTLATSVLGIDRERLWASYFAGGQVLDELLPSDEVTRQAWIRTGLPEERVIGLGPKDNYWVQGDGIDGMQTPRKAGPNTELFYDRGVERGCGVNCKPGCRCGRFLEFSNSLFICRELDTPRGVVQPLDDPFTETVIGTERVAMILQNAPTVFETDSHRSIVETVHSFVHAHSLPEPVVRASERVIADYLKALYVLVADGAPQPGKNGRERIVKLLIRGVMTRQLLLGVRSPEFLPTVLVSISQIVNAVVPELTDEKRLLQYFATESRRFLNTIERGQRECRRLLISNGGSTLSGPQIVRLEKQWGLPSLLTASMLWERGLPFAEAEYREALETWRHEPHN